MNEHETQVRVEIVVDRNGAITDIRLKGHLGVLRGARVVREIRLRSGDDRAGIVGSARRP